MQRQSLGSPVSKLHSHGGGAKGDVLEVDDQKHKNASSSSSSAKYCEQADDKAFKPYRLSFSAPSPPRQGKFVHIIPILTLICFLLLYLCSHSPSQSDLAQFHGFKRIQKHLDAVVIKSGVGELIEPKKDDILATQSLRNLKEIGKSHSLKTRPPRKVADF